MARPLRIEFEDAFYHVMARGNARQDIFLNDTDRLKFIENLGRVAKRFDWVVWAWCLMDNHYHLLIQTRQPTLSKGMREVNGIYTQAFNRRHGRVGHVLQGRYKAILIDQDSYLLELSRYVVLNPVRAGLVQHAAEFSWSSYRAVMGKAPAPDWLPVEDILSMFHSQRGPARRAYARFVSDGVGADDPYEAVERAGFLGGEAFMERVFDHIDHQALSPEIVRRDRPAVSLVTIAQKHASRDTAIQAAYKTGAYTITEIAAFFGIHRSTASRIARR